VKRCHTHVGAPDNRIKAFLKKEHVLTPRGKDMNPVLGPVVTASPLHRKQAIIFLGFEQRDFYAG
jgi:hypothetical protein